MNEALTQLQSNRWGTARKIAVSSPAEFGQFKQGAKRSDLTNSRQLKQDKVMGRSLGQVAAGGTVVGVVVVG